MNPHENSRMVPGTPASWGGAVLCGGRSRRMGRDKALLAVDGEPMVRRVARALDGAGAGRVVAIGGDQAAITAALSDPDLHVDGRIDRESGRRRGAASSSVAGGPVGSDRPDGSVAVVADDTLGQGPLGGILTALRVLDNDLVLAVACDLVAPSSAAMAATVAALSDDPSSDVAAPVHDGEVQWLHAAWRRRPARGPLAACFRAGERAVHRAVADAGLAVLTVPGLDPAALADADTPADLPASTVQYRRRTEQ